MNISVVLIYVVLLFFLLLLRCWIGIALGLVGFIGLCFLSNSGQLISTLTYNSLCGFTLTAVPLFVLMGEILLRGGAGDALYHGVGPLLERALPGGLLHANIVSSALFGAVCGSAIAGTATIATVAIPELKKRSYQMPFALGSIVGAGPLSSIIPPSLVFIIFGSLVQVSVSKLFVAGILPGVLFALLMMVAVAIVVKVRPQLVPRAPTIKLGTSLIALGKITPIVILGLGLIYAMYGGIATPTESAAVGVVGAVILSCGLYRRLNWHGFLEACGNTAKTCSVILFLIVGAQIFAFSISNSDLPSLLGNAFLALPGGNIMKVIILGILYIILGMFMDVVSFMIITLPVAFPIFTALGYDPLWTGVYMAYMGSIGGITPPVGLTLYMVQSISGVPAMTIFKGSIPFLIAQIVGVIVISLFPIIVTWLPSFM